MRHLAAAILLALGGKPVDENSVKAVLTAGGVKPDDAKVKTVVNAVKGKDVLQLAKEGLSKLGAGSVGGAAPAEKKKEEKVVEKKPEKKAPEPEPEEEMGMGGLFD